MAADHHCLDEGDQRTQMQNQLTGGASPLVNGDQPHELATMGVWWMSWPSYPLHSTPNHGRRGDENTVLRSYDWGSGIAHRRQRLDRGERRGGHDIPQYSLVIIGTGLRRSSANEWQWQCQAERHHHTHQNRDQNESMRATQRNVTHHVSVTHISLILS